MPIFLLLQNLFNYGKPRMFQIGSEQTITNNACKQKMYSILLRIEHTALILSINIGIQIDVGNQNLNLYHPKFCLTFSELHLEHQLEQHVRNSGPNTSWGDQMTWQTFQLHQFQDLSAVFFQPDQIPFFLPM